MIEVPDNLPNFHLGNLILILSAIAWAVAQLLKVPIQLLTEKRLDWRRVWESGGMPSSHSAFVCACAAATGNLYGFSSALFAIATVVAIVVMYDAANVRRAAGEHAKILNYIIENWDWDEDGAEDAPEDRPEIFGSKELKEFLGHSPSQVAVGAALGIAVGLIGTFIVKGWPLPL